MYCKKCGKEINDDDLFCYHCGAKQVDELAKSNSPNKVSEIKSNETDKKETQEIKNYGENFIEYHDKRNGISVFLKILEKATEILGGIISFIGFICVFRALIKNDFDSGLTFWIIFLMFFVASAFSLISLLSAISNGLILSTNFKKQKPPKESLLTTIDCENGKVAYMAFDERATVAILFTYDKFGMILYLAQYAVQALRKIICMFVAIPLVGVLKNFHINFELEFFENLKNLFEITAKTPTAVIFIVLVVPLIIASLILSTIRNNRENKILKKWEKEKEIEIKSNYQK